MKRTEKSARRALLIGLGPVCACAAGGAWLLHSRGVDAATRQTYVRSGFGGFAPLQKVKPPSGDPLAPIEAAYVQGRYTEAEQLAGGVIAASSAATDPVQLRNGVRAEMVAAYSAARRGEFPLARERFAEMRDRAAALPDHGAAEPVLGEIRPSLEEEGAFQHAVCTGQVQGQTAAEQEYDQFMVRYPQSVLVHAAVKRIARLHHGNIPTEAETLWKTAMTEQKQKTDADERERSLCGPECLAELLRRAGKPADVHALADAMQTSKDGTSVASFVDVAGRQGIAMRGMELSLNGLIRQKRPVVALISPGHYVIVEQANVFQVTVWDPDALGTGRGDRKSYPSSDWQRVWDGTTLVP